MIDLNFEYVLDRVLISLNSNFDEKQYFILAVVSPGLVEIIEFQNVFLFFGLILLIIPQILKIEIWN